jgi:HAD superfamily hydrolase (TIGR01549 family)
MRKKKLFIFDFDGVIYDATELQIRRIIDSAKLALADSKTKAIVPDHDFLKQCWGISIEQMSQLFIKRLNWNKNQANLFLFYERDKEDNFESGLANNFKPLTKKIKNKGINMAICSNRYSSSFYSLARKLSLEISDFEFIILGDSLKGIKKPDKRVLSSVFTKYDREEVILIGDTILTDLATAINSRIDFVGISSILHSEKEFKQSFMKSKLDNKYFVLDQLSKLETLLS